MPKRYQELLSEEIECPLLEPKGFNCDHHARRPLVAYCHLGKGRPIGYNDFNPVGTINVRRGDFAPVGGTASAAPLISLFPEPEIDVDVAVEELLDGHLDLDGESVRKDEGFKDLIRAARAHALVSGSIYRLEETGMISDYHAMRGNYNERPFKLVQFLFAPPQLKELSHDPTQMRIQNGSGTYVETHRVNFGENQPYNIEWKISEVGNATLHHVHLESFWNWNGATKEVLDTALIQLSDLTAYRPLPGESGERMKLDRRKFFTRKKLR